MLQFHPHMKRITLLILSTLSIPQASEVFIYKQRHLRAKQITTDIESGKKLPQYENQVDIFLKLRKQIENKEIDTVIAEGCEGDIDKNFKYEHYGWSYEKLKINYKSKMYHEIMAHIPLKLEVLFQDKLKTICGDKTELLKQNAMAFSDLAGYSGFYTRLLQYKNDNNKKLFNKYAEAILINNIENKEVDPIQFTYDKTVQAIKNIEKTIIERNKYFMEAIKKNRAKKIAIVIGGIHALDLKKRLKNAKILFQEVTPKGYSTEDEQLITKLKLIFK